MASEAEAEQTKKVREAREASTYLAWQSHLGVTMQTERLRASHADDGYSEGTRLVDCTGLILALWRLRLAGAMARRLASTRGGITAALTAFDAATPDLSRLRHVTMHFDEYALETAKRRNTIGDPPRLVTRADLWDIRADATGITWLEVRLDYASVATAARALYDAIQGENNVAPAPAAQVKRAERPRGRTATS